jgi:hypothetical protein
VLTIFTAEQILSIFRHIGHTNPAATPREEVTDVSIRSRTADVRRVPSGASTGRSALPTDLRYAPLFAACTGIRRGIGGVDAIADDAHRARPIAGN